MFIHLAKEQEAIEDLNIPEDEKLAMEEKLEDNLLNNIDDEIIEAVQGNDTINNIGDLQDVVETYSEKLDAIESLGAKYLGFFSAHFLKTREKYNSFAQFVCFLREVCLLFNL